MRISTRRKARVAACLAIVLFGGAFANATPATAIDWPTATLAHFFQTKPEKVSDAVRIDVEGAKPYTHVLFGRYGETTRYKQSVALLLRCGRKECKGARIWLEPGEIQLFGLYDLSGPEATIETRKGTWKNKNYWDKQLHAKATRMKWPVLVVETRTEKAATGMTRFGNVVQGSERTSQLQLISLRKADDKRPVVFSEFSLSLRPTGGGMSATFRIQPGKKGEAPVIVGREQRELDSDSGCLRPEPTEDRYVMQEGRFQKVVGLPKSLGCY